MSQAENADEGKEVVRYGNWDSILHDFLAAHQIAKGTPKEDGTYWQVLGQELISNADLRTKVKAWPHLAKRIIGCLPRLSRQTTSRFVRELVSG